MRKVCQLFLCQPCIPELVTVSSHLHVAHVARIRFTRFPCRAGSRRRYGLWHIDCISLYPLALPSKRLFIWRAFGLCARSLRSTPRPAPASRPSCCGVQVSAWQKVLKHGLAAVQPEERRSDFNEPQLGLGQFACSLTSENPSRVATSPPPSPETLPFPLFASVLLMGDKDTVCLPMHMEYAGSKVGRPSQAGASSECARGVFLAGS